MTQKKFNNAAIAIFTVAGLLHLSRVSFDFDLMFGEFLVPDFISWMIVSLTLFLAWTAWKLNKK